VLLQFLEYDTEGLQSAIIWFDEDDLDAAIAELDDRYIAGEGAECADVVRLGARYFRSLNALDWPALADTLADDFVLVDHRRLSLGPQTSRDEWLESIKAMRDLSPDRYSVIVAYHALRPDSNAIEVWRTGTSEYGGEVEDRLIAVSYFRGGRIARSELFAVDQLDAALVCFGELTQRRPDLDNACTRLGSRWRAAFERRDWPDLEACIAEGYVMEDRRQGLQNAVEGRAAIMSNARNIADLGAQRMDSRTLAVRGERLALSRREAVDDRSESGWTVVFLSLEELDEDGLLSATVTFDADDLDAAVAELDDRYIAGEAAEAAGVVRTWSQFVRHANARDWTAARSLLTDDFALVDHRPAALGKQTGDSWIESMRVQTDLSRDMRAEFPRYHALSPAGCVVENVLRGTSHEESSIEIANLLVTGFEGDAIAHIEMFPLERLDSALARFHQMQASAQAPEAQLENLAVRVEAQARAHLLAKDWSTFESFVADDIVMDDRRTGMRNVVKGKPASLAGGMAMMELGITSIDIKVLATRGNRLALNRVTFAGPGGPADFHAVALQVLELDADGLQCANVFFDEAALDAAYAELDERFASGEGAAYPVWRVLIDTLPTRVIEVCSIEPTTIVFRRLRTGSNEEGGHTEVSSYQVAVASNGALCRIEEFPIEDRAAALARFAELSADSDSAE
jgi:ketosteroid isomerase-like protein